MEATRTHHYGDISRVSKTTILGPMEQLLQNSESLELRHLTDTILLWAQQIYGNQEFALAKRDFFMMTGQVFPEDRLFHQRIDYFLCWFTFERPINPGRQDQDLFDKIRSKDFQRTPYQAFVEADHLEKALAPPKIIHCFNELRNFRHSLFQVTRIVDRIIHVRDIMRNERLKVSMQGNIAANTLELGSILQGYLFPLQEQNLCAQGVIIHPRSVAKLIKQFVASDQKQKRVENDPVFRFNFLSPLLCDLAKKNLKTLNLRLFNPKNIYKQKSRS